MSLLEDKLLNNVNLDPTSEHILLSLVSDLNVFLANHPNLDFGSVIDNIRDLVNTQDKLTSKNSNLVEKNNELFSELLKINACFDTFKELKSNELNESFKIQDLMVEEKESLSNKLSLANARCAKLQDKLNKVKKENDELKKFYYTTETDSKSSINNDEIIILKNKLVERDNALKLAAHKLNSAVELNGDLMSKAESLQAKYNHSISDKWLDDSVLESYFSSFQENSKATACRALFIGPLNCELLKHGSPDVINNLCTDLGLKNTNYAFCCISNSTVSEIKEHLAEGCRDVAVGSHWSLLFLDLKNKSAFHLDSIKSLNLEHAQLLCKNIGLSSWSFNDVTCPQQNNSFECGLNVLIHAKIILHWFCSDSPMQASFEEWFKIFSTDSHKMTCTKPNSSEHVLELDKTTSHHVVKNNVKSKKLSLHLRKQVEGQWEIVKHRNNNHSKNKHSKNKRNESKKGNNMRKTIFKVVDKCIETYNRFDILKSIDQESPPNPPLVSNSHPEPSNQCPLLINPSPKINLCSYSFPDHTRVSKKTPDYPSIALCSDSHGRHVSRLLSNKCREERNVIGWVKPNGRLNHVLETVDAVSRSKCDIIVIMGGTNDVVNGRCSLDFSKLDAALGSTSSKKVILVGLPLRYDNPSLNPEVSRVNDRLKIISSKHDHATFLSVNSIPRSSFTRHGLHLNYMGKHQLADLILHSLQLSKSFVHKESSKRPLSYKPTLGPNVSTKTSSVPSKAPNTTSSPIHSKLVSKNVNKSRTFTGNHFLGEAQRPPGVTWARFLERTMAVNGGAVSG